MSDLNPSLGKYVCRFIETYLVHGEGDFLGRPFKLDGWQRRFIYRLYEYDAETLRRLVRRALLVLPKGNGKTELIAAIGLAELCGPVTLGADGRPEARTSPNIPCAAASYEQADRLFEAARTMVTEGPLNGYIDAFERELLLKDAPGRMFKIAAVAGTSDGGLPTAFLADEIHEWVGRKERVHLVVGNSLSKREAGLELNISTPDAADPNSLLGKLYEYGGKVNSGEIDDPSFLFVHYTAPPNIVLDEPEQLREGLRVSHPASWVDIERVAQRWEVDKIPEHEFRRYHLAQFVRGADQWLPAGAWQAVEDRRRVVEDGEEIWIGFDGSNKHDATALVGCTADGHLFVIGVWERPERAPEDFLIPRNEVHAAVERAFNRWNVRELACDPNLWVSEIEEWAALYGENRVIHFTMNPSNTEPACARFYSGVVQKQLTQDGNPAFSRHIHNAVVHETRKAYYITKESSNSPRRIDLAYCAVMAYDRAMQRVSEGFLLAV